MQSLSGSPQTIAQYVGRRASLPGLVGAHAADGVALFGADAGACAILTQACSDLGLRAHGGSDAWCLDQVSGRLVGVLVLIYADKVDEAQIHLAQTCRAFGACRLVLVGPAFGTGEAERALICGFDEVWPSAMSHQLCVALLQRAWHTATQLMSSDSASTFRVGPLAVGRHPDACTYHDRTVYLGKDSVALLKVLVAHYPQPISRASLIEAMGKTGSEWALNSRAIDMAVVRLRHRLRATEIHDVQVSTLRGVGYRLTVV